LANLERWQRLLPDQCSWQKNDHEYEPPVRRVTGLVVTGIDFNIAVIAPTARAKSVPFLLSLRRKGIRRAPHGGVPQIVAQRIPLPRDALQTKRFHTRAPNGLQ
jgi:hypothetical protein